MQPLLVGRGVGWGQALRGAGVPPPSIFLRTEDWKLGGGRGDGFVFSIVGHGEQWWLSRAVLPSGGHVATPRDTVGCPIWR